MKRHNTLWNNRQVSYGKKKSKHRQTRTSVPYNRIGTTLEGENRSTSWTFRSIRSRDWKLTGVARGKGSEGKQIHNVGTGARLKGWWRRLRGQRKKRMREHGKKRDGTRVAERSQSSRCSGGAGGDDYLCVCKLLLRAHRWWRRRRRRQQWLRDDVALGEWRWCICASGRDGRRDGRRRVGEVARRLHGRRRGWFEKRVRCVRVCTAGPCACAVLRWCHEFGDVVDAGTGGVWWCVKFSYACACVRVLHSETQAAAVAQVVRHARAAVQWQRFPNFSGHESSNFFFFFLSCTFPWCPKKCLMSSSHTRLCSMKRIVYAIRVYAGKNSKRDNACFDSISKRTIGNPTGLLTGTGIRIMWD